MTSESQPPPRSQQETAREVARQAERSRQETTPAQLPDAALPAAQGQAAARSGGLQLASPAVTAGRGGERTIRIEKVHVEVNGNLPCYFNVTSTPGHALEVLVEQVHYRKSYSGTAALRTDVIPIAAIGTRGRVVVHDTTTGETLEQPWTWHLIGRPSLLGRLWATLRRLFISR